MIGLLSCLRAADRSKPARIGLSSSVSLSGVTPGERVELSIRRVSFTALLADQLTQGQTRWSIPPFVYARHRYCRLARSFLTGEPTVGRIVPAPRGRWGETGAGCGRCARRYVASLEGRDSPRAREVIQFFCKTLAFKQAARSTSTNYRSRNGSPDPQQMQPVAAAAAWDLPVIESAGDLADWLRMPARRTGLVRRPQRTAHRKTPQRLRHIITTASWRNDPAALRLIEAPKPRLKEIQRRIYNRDNRQDSAAFRPSMASSRPFHPDLCRAARGPPVVLRMDLQDFFPSFPAARIQTVFRTWAIPNPSPICWEASALSPLRRMSGPKSAYAERDVIRRPHLPKARPPLRRSPTSALTAPIAALPASPIPQALITLATPTISRSPVEKILNSVSTASHCTPLRSCWKKDSPSITAKRASCAKACASTWRDSVVNQRINVMRSDFDRLKATLNNCVRLGAQSQAQAPIPVFEHI